MNISGRAFYMSRPLIASKVLSPMGAYGPRSTSTYSQQLHSYYSLGIYRYGPLFSNWYARLGERLVVAVAGIGKILGDTRGTAGSSIQCRQEPT